MNLLQIFLSFFKVGLFTFGGGYAMLPIFEREIIDNRGWASRDELLDYYAIGQCTPGAIAVNTSVFIGRKLKGVSGGIAAALGVSVPSLIIITAIASLLTNYADIPAVQSAFSGIRVCVCVLIFNSVCKLYKKAVVDKAAFVIFLAVCVLSCIFDISPVIFVLVSAVAGLVIKSLEAKAK